jgi:hypothetical protein
MACSLWQGLTNFLPRMVSNWSPSISASKVAEISDMNHHCWLEHAFMICFCLWGVCPVVGSAHKPLDKVLHKPHFYQALRVFSQAPVPFDVLQFLAAEIGPKIFTLTGCVLAMCSHLSLCLGSSGHNTLLLGGQQDSFTSWYWIYHLIRGKVILELTSLQHHMDLM